MDIDTNKQSIIYREIERERWRSNFGKYINMGIEDREFSTEVTPLPAQKRPRYFEQNSRRGNYEARKKNTNSTYGQSTEFIIHQRYQYFRKKES